MRVGLELDGVVCDIVRAAEEAWGKPDVPCAYSLEEMYPMVSSDNLSLWRSSNSTYRRMHPVPHACESLVSLSDNHHIVVITSRPKHLSKVTQDWLKLHGLDFVRVIHTYSKDAQVVTSRIDVFIESLADVANAISDVCDVYLFNQPYNAGRTVQAKRVGDWKQLVKELT
jgi:uncharacterized HAD superfamily protein